MNIKELNASLIENTKLTDEEEAAAIFEAKRKKYFKAKHKDYWTTKYKHYESDLIWLRFLKCLIF